MARRKASEAERLAAEAAAEVIPEFVRENMRAIIDRLWELANSTKKVYVTCPYPGCGKRHEVEVPDTMPAVRAIDLLLRRGVGSPPEQAGGVDTGLTVIRTVVPPKGAA